MVVRKRARGSDPEGQASAGSVPKGGKDHQAGLRGTTRPLEEAATVSLLRTADTLEQGFEQLIRPWGISATQYNVLRILRGAEPEGLTCGQAGERLITHDPDVTRLLDRLESRQLITRSRDRHDRRVIMARITAEGLRILAELDAPVVELHRRQLGHLGEQRLKILIRLLELCRVPSREAASHRGVPAAGGSGLDLPAGQQVKGGKNGR